MNVTAIKTLVEQGRYEVDSQLVADAIICRMLGRAMLDPPGARATAVKTGVQTRRAPHRRRGS